jgi:hypothetical protein
MTDLPILDVSWCDTYRWTPDDPFAALNQRTDEEDARLQELLGIPLLAKEWSEHAHVERGKVLVFGRLVPVGQTTEGEIIAVALQLATTKGYSDGTWVAFICHPERYDDLQQAVEAKLTQYRNYIENMLRGVEGKN